MREIREIKEIREVKDENPTIAQVANCKFDQWLIDDLTTMIAQITDTTNKGE